MKRLLIGLELLVLFAGCATVVPVYETAQIEEGFGAGAGIAYQWADYSEDSASYKYNLVRTDLLFDYGLTREIGIIGGIFGVIGKGRGWETSVIFEEDTLWYEIDDSYWSGNLGIKISPFSKFFDNLPIVPALSIMGELHPLWYIQSNICIGVKSKKRREILTVGTRLLFLQPYEIFLALHPYKKISLAFGFSLFPLWEWNEWEHLNPQDFVVGIGVKIK